MLDLIKNILGISSVDLSREDLENGTIVDVRTTAEFQQGHVNGSINVPLQIIDSSLVKLRQMKQPIITCCRSGSRSSIAARQLNSNGIKAINGGPWQTVNRQLKA